MLRRVEVFGSSPRAYNQRRRARVFAREVVVSEGRFVPSRRKGESIVSRIGPRLPVLVLALAAGGTLGGCYASGTYTSGETTQYGEAVVVQSSGGEVGDYDADYDDPAPTYIVAEQPPPPRTIIVSRPPPPWPDAVWVGGYWTWNNGQFFWVTGRWIAPRTGYVYVQPQWHRRGHQWVFIAGYYRPVSAGTWAYWSASAPPPPRVEVRPARPYSDAFWIEGHWVRESGRWYWRRGRWERSRPGYVYAPSRWEQRGGRWYYYRGRYDRPGHRDVRPIDHRDVRPVDRRPTPTRGDRNDWQRPSDRRPPVREQGPDRVQREPTRTTPSEPSRTERPSPGRDVGEQRPIRSQPNRSAPEQPRGRIDSAPNRGYREPNDRGPQNMAPAGRREQGRQRMGPRSRSKRSGEVRRMAPER